MRSLYKAIWFPLVVGSCAVNMFSRGKIIAKGDYHVAASLKSPATSLLPAGRDPHQAPLSKIATAAPSVMVLLFDGQRLLKVLMTSWKSLWYGWTKSSGEYRW